MDADPVFYKRFSELVRETIEEFRAGRLSEQDYLDRIVRVRDEVVAGSRADQSVPESVRDDDQAGALYRNSEPILRDAVGTDASTVAADTALAFAAIVRRHRKIGWQDDIDVQNDIRNAMDDFLYDEIKGNRGIFGLDTATMDAVMDSALAMPAGRPRFDLDGAVAQAGKRDPRVRPPANGPPYAFWSHRVA